MSDARVVSVNTGRTVPVPYSRAVSGVDKRPRTGRVRVDTTGVEGDQVGDVPAHGGVYKAVYAFAQEDLDRWCERLAVPVRPGLFGENLTTSGIDVNDALVGEQWRVGSALLEVVSVRIPCRTFAGWLAENGIDTTGWIKRFTVVGRPGPYLRVLQPGDVAADDPIVVEHRPEHGVTVAEMFRALTTERNLLPRLVGLDRLEPEIEEIARRYVTRTAGPTVTTANAP
jgi:MOSC domain-containing protein YiiM